MSAAAPVKFAIADEGMRRQAEQLAAALTGILSADAAPMMPVQVINLAAASASAERERSIVVPLLLYSHFTDAGICRLLLPYKNNFCLLLNVYADFPFLPALRRRAAPVLNEMSWIELPPPAGDAVPTVLLTRLADGLRTPPPPESGQATAPPAKKTEQPSAAAMAIKPVDLPAFAEMLGFPLAALYDTLSDALPPVTARPQPDAEAETVAYDKIQAVLRYANQSGGEKAVAGYRFAACCLLLLAHRCRRSGKSGVAYLQAAEQALGERGEQDASFALLRKFILLLLAESLLLKDDAEQAYRLIAALPVQLPAADAEHRELLLHGFFLRLLILLFEKLNRLDEQRECIRYYRQLLQSFNDTEAGIIGAATSARLSRLRQEMEDIL